MYLRVSNRPKGQYLTICEKYRDKASALPKTKPFVSSAMRMTTDLSSLIL